MQTAFGMPSKQYPLSGGATNPKEMTDMDSDTLEQARRYCDDAFKLLADEIAVLRKDAWLLNRRLEQKS